MRRARRWWRVAGEVFRREGLGRVLVRAWIVVCGVVYRHVLVVGLDLARPLPQVAGELAAEIRLLEPGDTDAYARFRAGSAQHAARRLGRGDLCVAAWLGGEIVSAAWLSFEAMPVEEIGRELYLSRGDVCVYDSFTAVGRRGLGVAAQRARWTAEYLRANRYRRIVGWIQPQNRPAFGPVQAMGYEALGIAGFVRLGPWRRDFVRPVGQPRRWWPRGEPIDTARDFGARA